MLPNKPETKSIGNGTTNQQKTKAALIIDNELFIPVKNDTDSELRNIEDSLLQEIASLTPSQRENLRIFLRSMKSA